MKRRIIYAAGLSMAIAIAVAAASITNDTVSGSTSGLVASATPKPKTVKLTITVLGPDRKPAADVQVDITHDAYGPEFRAYDYRLKTDGNGIASTNIIIGEKWNEGEEWYQYTPVVDIEVIKDGARGRGRVKFVNSYYQDRETGEWGRVKERDGVKFLGPDYRSKETIEIVMHAVDSRGFSLVSVQVHVEHENGDAADGAKVVISGSTASERYQGVTGANGDTTIPVAATFAGKGTFGIEASKNRYISAKTVLELYDKDIGEVVAAPTVKIKQVAGVAVTINVKDKDSTFGVGEARVVLDGGAPYFFETNMTDSSGTATFFVPQRGNSNFAVKISRNSYEPLNDGQVRLSEDDDSKTVEFFLKAKPKKTEGRNSIEVKVLQGDKIERLGGYNLPLPDAVVTAAGIIRSTDRSGQVKIEGFFEGNVEVVVEAKGYKRQTRTVQMSKEERFTGGTASIEFMMQPESSEGSIEVSVVAAGKNDEGPIPLAGVTVTAGGETTTTSASGRAKLTGDFGESVEVAVEKSGYLRQAKSVNASGGKGSATFTLQNEPVEDSVSITVMALDPKGGSSTPVAGALVSAKGQTATTDKGGKATITGDFKDGVEVEAKAKDFVSQVQQVSIAKPERTGSANFLLQPKTLLSLIIEVRDAAAPNNRLEEALVYVRPLGKTIGPMLASQMTNAQGEAHLEMRGSAEQISQFRSGLTLHVGKDKYKAKLSDIAAGQLKDSTEALRWTVFLERDWTELANALGKLEAEAASLSNDIREADVKRKSVEALAAKSVAARGRAESWMRELNNAWLAFSGARVKSLTRCQEAVTIKESIRSLQTEAVGKERQLKTSLNEATALAAACSSQADADSISSKHKNAIRLVGEIGALGQKALDANQKLLRYAEVLKDAGTLQLQVQQVIDNIDNELTAAKADASTADADYNRALVLSKGIPGRRGQMQSELDRLKTEHEVATYYSSIPKELIKRLEGLAQQLGSYNNDFGFGALPDASRRDVVKEAVTAIQGYKTSVDGVASMLSSDLKCDVQPMDDVVEDIRTVVRNSGFELGLAADLPNKAAECAKRGACLPLVEEVRALIKSGALQSAEAKLNQARGQGCDLSALPGGASLAEELDYYKTLNEAVTLLKTAQGNCKFQDALNWAGQLPESIRSTPSIANALSEIRSGLGAQQRIQQLRNAARDAVASANTMTAADPFIRQAEQIAAPVPCLVEEVSRFRAEFPVNTDKKPVDKIEVEEIPDDSTVKDPTKTGKTEGGGFWDSTKEKAGAGHKPPLVVEEIPDDDNRTTAGHKAPGKGTKTVEVEEIPEDDNTATKTAGVEEIPEDDNAGASTKTGGSSSQTAGNRSSDKPKKEKKPKDPNKPSFWDRLATAAGETIRDNVGGGAGNTGGPTNPGSGAGGGGGQGLDLSGTWIVTNRYRSKEHTERGFHYPESIKVDTERWEITALGDNRWKVRSTVVSKESLVGSAVVGTTNEGTFSAVDEGGGRLRFITPNGQNLYTYSQNQFSSTETSAGYFEVTFTAKRQ